MEDMKSYMITWDEENAVSSFRCWVNLGGYRGEGLEVVCWVLDGRHDVQYDHLG